jgi:hypothetical protein
MNTRILLLPMEPDHDGFCLQQLVLSLCCCNQFFEGKYEEDEVSPTYRESWEMVARGSFANDNLSRGVLIINKPKLASIVVVPALGTSSNHTPPTMIDTNETKHDKNTTANVRHSRARQALVSLKRRRRQEIWRKTKFADLQQEQDEKQIKRKAAILQAAQHQQESPKRKINWKRVRHSCSASGTMVRAKDNDTTISAGIVLIVVGVMVIFLGGKIISYFKPFHN